MLTAQAHFDKAIQEVEHRNPANRPVVDLSIQCLDNGMTISTRERIIKDVRLSFSVIWIIAHSYVRPQVAQPAVGIPTDAQFFSPHDPNKPNLDFLKDHFFHEGRIREEQALWIVEKATALLHSEPNVLDIDAPVTGEISR